MHCWPSRCKVLGVIPALQKVFIFLPHFSLSGGAVEAQADIQHRKGKGFGSDEETH